MLAVKADSHPNHAVHNMSTSAFTESVFEGLLRSELNGEMYDPGRSTTQRAWPVNGPAADTEETDREEHVLVGPTAGSPYTTQT